ncbi:MAG: LPS export ABC transporter periplasmic protein LptC [Cryomorphaceae bacterium]|nr:LPS export ABC transporter periplasmic protein LptC [Cryomorphaceae bacterium]|tara:strand:- start:378 stop:923 length:546 start_codon:yes stop_codon:yes gene_type:complete
MFRVLVSISLLLTGILLACENNSGEIQRVTHFENAPDEYTENLNMFHNDSGQTKVNLYAKVSHTSYEPKHITNFKDYLRVDFFDKSGDKVSTLVALSGVFDHDEGVVEVQDSVRLFNYAREQQLETEYLIWNKKDSTIRTDRNVLVRSPKEILKGKGLVTKQDFSFFEILEPTGKINLKKE